MNAFRQSKTKERTLPAQVILKVIHRVEPFLCTDLARERLLDRDENFGNKNRLSVTRSRAEASVSLILNWLVRMMGSWHWGVTNQ